MEPQQPFNNPDQPQPEQPVTSEQSAPESFQQDVPAPVETPAPTPAPEQSAPVYGAPVAPVEAVVAAAPVVAAPIAAVSGKKGLAIAALALSIVSVLLGVVWFIAAPLALTAIILAIVSLVKKHGGKGMSIAGLIVGGVSLLIFVPFWAFVSLVGLAGLQDAADDAVIESQSSSELYN